MATIIEVQNEKIEHLTEYAEMLVKYSHKLAKCLKAIDELSEERYMESYIQRKHKPEDEECDEYYRYM